jgi:catalase
VPEQMAPDAHKVRGKAERFADHYTQARLFWNSQTPTEKQHIINAFRFELSRVQTPAVRERMIAGLLNVAPELAEPIAAGLGMRELPAPLPKVLERDVTPEVTKSPALSLLARPGDGGIAARRVAIFVADDVEGESLRALHARLVELGAVPRFVGARLGAVNVVGGDPIEVDVTVEATPSVLYDAVVIPDGDDAIERLTIDGRTLEFLKDQYRHCKPMLAIGAGQDALKLAGIPSTLISGKGDPGLVFAEAASIEQGIDAFIAALAMHRHFERETDPPRV